LLQYERHDAELRGDERHPTVDEIDRVGHGLLPDDVAGLGRLRFAGDQAKRDDIALSRRREESVRSIDETRLGCVGYFALEEFRECFTGDVPGVVVFTVPQFIAHRTYAEWHGRHRGGSSA